MCERIWTLPERGELLLLSLTCYSSYAIQRMGHAFPVLRPAVFCCTAFPSVPVLCSTGSAASCPALFVGFSTPMTESDFPRLFITGYASSPSRCRPARLVATDQTWDLPVPVHICQVLRPRR